MSFGLTRRYVAGDEPETVRPSVKDGLQKELGLKEEVFF